MLKRSHIKGHLFIGEKTRWVSFRQYQTYMVFLGLTQVTKNSTGFPRGYFLTINVIINLVPMLTDKNVNYTIVAFYLIIMLHIVA